jgi:hypothetical protein
MLKSLSRQSDNNYWKSPISDKDTPLYPWDIELLAMTSNIPSLRATEWYPMRYMPRCLVSQAYYTHLMPLMHLVCELRQAMVTSSEEISGRLEAFGPREDHNSIVPQGRRKQYNEG